MPARRPDTCRWPALLLPAAACVGAWAGAGPAVANAEPATRMVGELVEGLGGRLTVRDGAVVGIHLGKTRADDETLRGLLPCAATLEELSLADTAVSDAGLETLARFVHLRALHLAGSRVRGPGLESLAVLTDLRLLGLKGTGVEDRHLASLAGLNRLEWLGLRDTAIGDAGLGHVARIRSLQGLSLSRTKVKTLAPLAVLVGMRRLLIDDLGLVAGDLAVLRSFPELHTLDVSGNPLDDEAAAALARLPRLASVDVSRTRITAAGVRELTGLAALRQPIDLPATIVAGVANPVPVPVSPGLGLGGIGVDAEALAACGNCAGIRWLVLDGGRFDEAALERLVAGLPGLRELSVRDVRIEPAVLDRLRLHHPDLAITPR